MPATGTGAVAEEVRPFTGSSGGPIVDRSIHASIQRVLAESDAIEPGRKSAVVGYYDGKDPKLAVMFKPNEKWTFVGTLNHSPSGGWDKEAAIRWSPF